MTNEELKYFENAIRNSPDKLTEEQEEKIREWDENEEMEDPLFNDPDVNEEEEINKLEEI